MGARARAARAGFSSTTTWAGARLAHRRDATERRGELIGTAFGAAVFGAILGPMFGAVADAVSVRVSFAAVGVVAAALAAWAAGRPRAAPEQQAPGAVSRLRRPPLRRRPLAEHAAGVALRHVVLVPLQLDEGGFTPFAIGAVFLLAGLIETGANPCSALLRPPRPHAPDPNRAGRVRRRRARLRRGARPLSRRGADDPRRDHLRRLLHARDGTRLRPGRAAGLSQAIGFDHEHRLGARGT